MSDVQFLPGALAIGLNTTKKALKKGIASKVFLAHDADAPIRSAVIQKAEEGGVAVNSDYSMGQLGVMCAIEVPCAVCCLLKDA